MRDNQEKGETGNWDVATFCGETGRLEGWNIRGLRG
jgi:hypothetical protein